MLSNGFTFKSSDISDFWAQGDHNKDGLLTVKEIKKMLENDDAAVSFYTKNEKVNLIFYYYDLDKDNFLNVSEVQKILKDAYGISNINDAGWFLG
jgi:Ca2+-binding EF-hand superfamily protein